MYASLDFGGQRAFSGVSGAVVMFFDKVFYPVIDIIRDWQQCQLVHQSHVSDRVERLCEIKREDVYCTYWLSDSIVHTVWSSAMIAAAVEPDVRKANWS